MIDALKQLHETVCEIAQEAARAVLRAAVAETSEMQRKADALICDAQVAAKKWAALDGLIQSAAKASQDSFLASAARTEIAVLDVQQDVRVQGCGGPSRVEYQIGGSRFYAESQFAGGFAQTPQLLLPAGRYTMVLSLYRQDANGEMHRALAALRSGG